MKTIVTGLPHSGTSMMMQILQAGGMELVYDKNFKKPDEHNPNGYFECANHFSGFKIADGKAVKILIPGINSIKEGNIIWINRDLEELYLSYKELKEEKINIINNWIELIKNTKERLKERNILEINHRDIIYQPKIESLKISKFLNVDLDIDRMVSIIDLKLYRSKTENSYLTVING